MVEFANYTELSDFIRVFPILSVPRVVLGFAGPSPDNLELVHDEPVEVSVKRKHLEYAFSRMLPAEVAITPVPEQLDQASQIEVWRRQIGDFFQPPVATA
jgi:hypothetical protein